MSTADDANFIRFASELDRTGQLARLNSAASFAKPVSASGRTLMPAEIKAQAMQLLSEEADAIQKAKPALSRGAAFILAMEQNPSAKQRASGQ